MEHHANPYIEFRKRFLRPLEKREGRFNGWLAVKITNLIGTVRLRLRRARHHQPYRPPSSRSNERLVTARHRERLPERYRQKLGPAFVRYLNVMVEIEVPIVDRLAGQIARAFEGLLPRGRQIGKHHAVHIQGRSIVKDVEKIARHHATMRIDTPGFRRFPLPRR
jgi:hypothetical protein